MSNITPFTGAGLPSLADLKGGLTKNRQTTPSAGGSGDMNFLQMDQGGDGWVFGRDRDPIEDDDRFLMDPRTFVHGYICWHNSSPEYKSMVPFSTPLSEVSVPEGLQGAKGAEYQRGVNMVGLSEGIARLAFEFSHSSMGGLQFLEDLEDAVIASPDGREFPVISLTQDSYTNKKYGKLIYTPGFEVHEWLTLADAIIAIAGAEAEPEPEETAEAARPGKPVEVVLPDAEPEPAEPEVAPNPAPADRSGRARRRRRG